MDVESDCEEVQKGKTPTMWDDNNRYIKRVVIQQKCKRVDGPFEIVVCVPLPSL